LENLYDLVIVGGGPAGLAAGIYGGRAKMNTLILEKVAPGGQALLTNELVNYPGFAQGSGAQIMEEWVNHAKGFGVRIKREQVREMELDGQIKTITTKKGNQYQARSIILAPGASPRHLGIKGEQEFTGSAFPIALFAMQQLFATRKCWSSAAVIRPSKSPFFSPALLTKLL